VLASTGGLVVPLIGAGMGGQILRLLLGGAARVWRLHRACVQVREDRDHAGNGGLVLTRPSWRETI
jgi:hypothetical protein